MASGQRTSSGNLLDVGATRITLPEQAQVGVRARQWARALPSLNYISEPPLEQIIEAIRQEARQEVLTAVEQAIVKEF